MRLQSLVILGCSGFSFSLSLSIFLFFFLSLSFSSSFSLFLSFSLSLPKFLMVATLAVLLLVVFTDLDG
jgi:hypothetical protein